MKSAACVVVVLCGVCQSVIGQLTLHIDTLASLTNSDSLAVGFGTGTSPMQIVTVAEPNAAALLVIGFVVLVFAQKALRSRQCS